MFYFIKDAYNMGGVMAYSAYKTLIDHLTNTKTSIKDYDLILYTCYPNKELYGNKRLIIYAKLDKTKWVGES